MCTNYLVDMTDKIMNNNEDCFPFIVNYNDQRDREMESSGNAPFSTVVHLKWFLEVCLWGFFLSQTNPINPIYDSQTFTLYSRLSQLFLLYIDTDHHISLHFLNPFHLAMNLSLHKLLLKYSVWLLWRKPDRIRLHWAPFYLVCGNNAHPFQRENHFISLRSNFP